MTWWPFGTTFISTPTGVPIDVYLRRSIWVCIDTKALEWYENLEESVKMGDGRIDLSNSHSEYHDSVERLCSLSPQNESTPFQNMQSECIQDEVRRLSFAWHAQIWGSFRHGTRYTNSSFTALKIAPYSWTQKKHSSCMMILKVNKIDRADQGGSMF